MKRFKVNPVVVVVIDDITDPGRAASSGTGQEYGFGKFFPAE
jgi:hypothetical protein